MKQPDGTGCIVAWDRPGQVWLHGVTLPEGATVSEYLAVAAQCYALQHPAEVQPDWRSCAVGIWGRQVARTTVTRAGDRLEIYRPLPGDPRERRRQRVAQKRRASGTRSGRRP